MQLQYACLAVRFPQLFAKKIVPRVNSLSGKRTFSTIVSAILVTYTTTLLLRPRCTKQF